MYNIYMLFFQRASQVLASAFISIKTYHAHNFMKIVVEQLELMTFMCTDIILIFEVPS